VSCPACNAFVANLFVLMIFYFWCYCIFKCFWFYWVWFSYTFDNIVLDCKWLFS